MDRRPADPYHHRVSQYLTFVAFAAVVAIAPGPDTLLTLRSSVVGGRGRGAWTAAGICAAGVIQGVLAAAGLGAVIVHVEPLFQAIRWVGVIYLAFLGITALRAALARAGTGTLGEVSGPVQRPWRAFVTGFLCNITNPKVLLFNLAVLPQFLSAGASTATFIAYALTLTALGAVVLMAIVLAAEAARGALQRARVRRGVDGGTGAAMLGFAGALAAGH